MNAIKTDHPNFQRLNLCRGERQRHHWQLTTSSQNFFQVLSRPRELSEWNFDYPEFSRLLPCYGEVIPRLSSTRFTRRCRAEVAPRYLILRRLSSAPRPFHPSRHLLPKSRKGDQSRSHQHFSWVYGPGGSHYQKGYKTTSRNPPKFLYKPRQLCILGGRSA